ncbi:MAG: two-component regulator propeller domain-containing protein [Chloroflexota bacterium]
MLSRILNFPIRALPKWWGRWHTIAFIVLISALIHAWAVWQLPLDYDEPVYMRAGREYAGLIKQGDVTGIINYEQNKEHPPLIKLIYSLPFLIGGERVDPDFEFYFNRAISAFFGVLQVFVLALFDPLAAFLLTFHSYTIKYTSQVYLEAFPLFAGLLAVLMLRRGLERKDSPDRNVYWGISAIAFGAAVAGKYTYGLMILPVIFLMIQHRQQFSLKRWLIWFGVAVLTFFFFNPFLWNEPVQRLVQIIAFHRQYSQGGDVIQAGYPWWQPVIWIATALQWHPRVFFFLTLDEFIFWAGVLGLYFYGRKQPWLTGWFVAQFIILLVYPTKWPQYSLIVIPALCLIASGVLRLGYAWIMEKESYWDYLEEMFPKPPKIFWWLIIVFSGLIIAGKVTYEYEQALVRRGWLHLTAETAPLPSNTIYDLFLSSKGDMVIATARGAALWHYSEGSPWGEDSRVFNSQNSGIGDERVRVVMEDSVGRLWFGSESGLSYYANDNWQFFAGGEFGVKEVRIRALTEDGKGRIWVGTSEGVYMWNGDQLISYSQIFNRLGKPFVFALGYQIFDGVEYLWGGTEKGVFRLNLQNNEIEEWDFSLRDLGWGGVSDLMVDVRNHVWISTIGSGVGRWDGREWTFYRLGTSNLPTSVVNTLIEQGGKGIWFGHGFPTEPGGLISRFDGENEWIIYKENNSGFVGGEPLTFALDSLNRLWIGTALNGIQIYDPSIAKR